MVKFINRFSCLVDEGLKNYIDSILGDVFPNSVYTPKTSSAPSLITYLDSENKIGFAIRGYTGTRTETPAAFGVSNDGGSNYLYSNTQTGQSTSTTFSDITFFEYDNGYILELGNYGYSVSNVLIIDKINMVLLQVCNTVRLFSNANARTRCFYAIIDQYSFQETSFESSIYADPTSSRSSWFDGLNHLEQITLADRTTGMFKLPSCSVAHSIISDGNKNFYVPWAPIAIELPK